MATTLRLAGLALVFAVATLAPGIAQASEAARGVWLAVTDDGSPVMGTLSLKEGKLAFRSSTTADSWEVDLSDAKRVELSKSMPNAIEVEDGWGETYVVKILNSRLTPESPSKAFKTISVALDSVKVVRVNGSQIR